MRRIPAPSSDRLISPGAGSYSAIDYLLGDATAPDRHAPDVIAHVRDDTERLGQGFVLALSRRSPEPEAA
jgi:hypothetical protein